MGSQLSQLWPSATKHKTWWRSLQSGNSKSTENWAKGSSKCYCISISCQFSIPSSASFICLKTRISRDVGKIMNVNIYLTRMHSSRMRTVRSSCRLLYRRGVKKCQKMPKKAKKAKKKEKLFWGVSAQGGCLLPGVGCLLPGGVSAPRAGCLLWGVVSQHALRQTHPPRGQTDACKNITFATSLRTVIILSVRKSFMNAQKTSLGQHSVGPNRHSESVNISIPFLAC